jgi:hypothetical protein
LGVLFKFWQGLINARVMLLRESKIFIHYNRRNLYSLHFTKKVISSHFLSLAGTKEINSDRLLKGCYIRGKIIPQYNHAGQR